jgi:hypothetical protein
LAALLKGSIDHTAHIIVNRIVEIGKIGALYALALTSLLGYVASSDCCACAHVVTQ